MRVNFSLEQILGRSPHEVGRLFRSQGLDPGRPYRSLVSFSGITIEQETNQVAAKDHAGVVAKGF